MTVETYTNLTAGTEYKVKVASGTNLVDYAAYGVTPTTVNFTYAPVTVAPTYTLKSSTETSITVEFSHEIKANTLVNNANVLATHTYNNATNQVNGMSVTNPSGDAKTFVIAFSNPLPPAASTVYMKYATGTLDMNKIKDNYGNVVELVNLTVNTEADTTAPTATVALAANSNTVIEITYNEPVTGATNSANYSLKKGTTPVAFNAPVLVSGNKYSITTQTPMSGDYVLEIKDVKDVSIAGNKIVTKTYSVSVADLIAPFVTNEDNETSGSTYFTQDSPTNKSVRIYFSEAMNQTDLANKALYVRGTENPTTANPAADGKSVNLVFPTASTGNITIGAVKDLAGNSISGFSAILTNVNASNVALHAVTTAVPYPAKSESTTTVTVALNDLVSGVTTSDFEVRKDGSNWVSPASFSINNSSGKSVLTLVLASGDKFGMDAANVQVRTVSAPGTQGTTANGENAFGTGINIAATNVVDRMAPEVDKVTFVSSTEIQVSFKENLLANSIALAGTNGFTVNGGTLNTAVKDANVDNVIVLTGTNFNSSTNVSYSGLSGITDVNNNKLGAFNITTSLTAGSITVVPSGTPDNKFTITTNFATTPLVIGEVDMDSATGVQDDITINGITYKATVVGGTVTIAVTGTATATSTATSHTFTINKNGAVKNVTFTIPVYTTGDSAIAPVINAQ